MSIRRRLFGGEAKQCPSDDLIKTLEEIGRLKNLCSHVSSQAELAEMVIDPPKAASRGLFNVLGLYVQLLSCELPPSVTHREHSIDGWTLQAGEQRKAHLEAWRAEFEDNWNVIKYKVGEWENLVSPTLELAKHIPKITGGITEKIHTVQEISSKWKETGQLDLSPPRIGNENLRTEVPQR